VERYEQLRRHALGAQPSSFRLGQALLERRGVAAWSRAWEGTTPAGMGLAPRASALAAAVPAGEELVGALASMALACVAAG
jgi:hypothetical protein